LYWTPPRNIVCSYVCTNLGERDHWGDPDADGRIILRWIFKKWEGVVGLDGVASG